MSIMTSFAVTPFFRPLNKAWRGVTDWHVFEGTYYRHLFFPFPVAEFADIEVRAISSAAGADVSMDFNILLIAN